jgi:hypothetical protein
MSTPLRDKDAPESAFQRWLPLGLVLVLVAGTAVLLLRPGARHSPPSSPASPADASATQPGGAVQRMDLDRLKGRWLRADSDYVVEIRSVEADGKLEAAYFNPQPIHVARAEAARDGSTIKVFLELRDVNYPGCTYTLKYEPQNDVLYGVYYQAALQQSFDVVFARMK